MGDEDKVEERQRGGHLAYLSPSTFSTLSHSFPSSKNFPYLFFYLLCSFISLPLNHLSLFLRLFYFSYFTIFLCFLSSYSITYSKILVSFRRALCVPFIQFHHLFLDPETLSPSSLSCHSIHTREVLSSLSKGPTTSLRHGGKHTLQLFLTQQSISQVF